MNLSVICSQGSEFRAECIKAHVPDTISTDIVIVDTVNQVNLLLFLKVISLILPLWTKNYVVLVVTADMLEFTSFLLKYSIIARKRIIVDYYDIYGIREIDQSKAFLTTFRNYEKRIFHKSKMFLARSFELKRYRKQFSCNKKKFLFFPDIYPLSHDNTNALRKQTKYKVNRLVFLGNFSIEYMEKLANLGTGFEIDVYLWHGKKPAKMKEICSGYSVKVNFYNSIDVHQFDEVLSKYHFGIVLISETSNVYQYSAAIKYMSYLKAGISVITDPRHKISRWYSRYYLKKFFFVDDRTLQSLSIDKLTDFLGNQQDIDSRPTTGGNIASINLSKRLSDSLGRFLYGS